MWKKMGGGSVSVCKGIPVFVVGASLAAASMARAAVITANSADYVIGGANSSTASVVGGGTINTTGTTAARAGTNGTATTAGSGKNYIIPFLLPTLAAGDSFTSATLTVQSVVPATSPPAVPTTFNADLYGLGVQATAGTTNSPTYYFEGASDARYTLLQDNFDTPAASAGNTALLTSTDLSAYLNTVDPAGSSNAGSYVYLRISPDAYPGDSTAYVFDTVESGAATAPSITYATVLGSVPEPASLGLVAAPLVGLLARRRRAR